MISEARGIALAQDHERMYGSQESNASTCRYTHYNCPSALGCSISLTPWTQGLIYTSSLSPLTYSVAGESWTPCSYQPVVRPGWFLDVLLMSDLIVSLMLLCAHALECTHLHMNAHTHTYIAGRGSAKPSYYHPVQVEQRS